MPTHTVQLARTASMSCWIGERGGGVNSWRSHTVHCKVVKCLLKGQDEDNIQVWVIGNIWQFCKKRRSHYKEFAFKRTTHFLNKHYNVVKRSLDVLCRADKKKKKNHNGQSVCWKRINRCSLTGTRNWAIAVLLLKRGILWTRLLVSNWCLEWRVWTSIWNICCIYCAFHV